MKKLSVLLYTLLLITNLFAGNPVDDFINNPLLQNANISLLVKDLETNKTISQFRSNNSTTPASTMKLVTTATALEWLGADFCFKTKLEIDGTITRDSVLIGNIYIRGGGDPTLGSEKLGDARFLDKWVDAIKHAGINTVKGNIIADASLYNDEGVNPFWTWEDIGNYYAGGVYGISYLDNSCKVLFRSGKAGTTPEITRTIPPIPGLTFENHLLSSNIAFDSCYFHGAPHSNTRSIYGEIPANRSEFIVKVDIPNPGLLLAQDFKKALTEHQVTVHGQATDIPSRGKNCKEIYTQISPPLSEIVRETNIKSNNHYAEQIFRYLALKDYPVASVVGALKVIKLFWKSKGLPVDQLFQYDGCGLSPMDAVSADFFVDLLIYMNNKSSSQQAFFKSLPVSGESGTLANLLKNTALQGKVHAKSGTITRVKTYAGYINANGKNYVFALLVNNANGSSEAVKRKMEKFLLQVSENNNQN
ncbi:MAG: D-alanyl-D-alanine carboxypeptidase/D-alanyl-D-alanine-endopeptidase [Paludibacter sp.]|nr:D-alanyl-D-alanine carboxypeptidase/D-alanyl-D-alanine-endopeptidase [Paludibacter sp.]